MGEGAGHENDGTGSFVFPIWHLKVKIKLPFRRNSLPWKPRYLSKNCKELQLVGTIVHSRRLYLEMPWTQLSPFAVDSKKRPLWLRDVGTPGIKGMLNALASTERLNKTTLGHIKAFLSGVFRLAIENGYYRSANPVHECRLPHVARGPAETYAYNLQEISQYLAAFPEPAATVVATVSYAGLRDSEVTGELWENYHDGKLFVSQSIWNGYTTEPKSAASKAAVPIIRQLAER